MTQDERRQAQEDGYVECSECGHCIEQHSADGCEVCDCMIRWTKRQIKDYRLSVGLPAEWRQ